MKLTTRPKVVPGGVPVPRVLDSNAPAQLPISCMVEAVCMAHLAGYVEGPFREAAGLFLVGPPGALKTTILEWLENYPSLAVCADVNAKMLNTLKNRSTFRTVVFPEYAKIWDRDPRTARNVEGTLKAMASEGWGSTAHQDATVSRSVSRVTVLAAMTEDFRDSHLEEWNATGYSRRFVWATFRVANPGVLDEAIDRWAKVELSDRPLPPVPAGGVIPNLTSRIQRAQVRGLLKFQPGDHHQAQASFLVKMLAAWQWWYRLDGRTEDEAFVRFLEFARTFRQAGGLLILPEFPNQDPEAQIANVAIAYRPVPRPSRVPRSKTKRRK